jgi:hypothetical protein
MVDFTQQHCYDFLKTLARFEPGSSAPEADAMSTAPRSQGKTIFVHVGHNNKEICFIEHSFAFLQEFAGV